MKWCAFTSATWINATNKRTKPATTAKSFHHPSDPFFQPLCNLLILNPQIRRSKKGGFAKFSATSLLLSGLSGYTATVYCRIGSLEKSGQCIGDFSPVYCRIGSLEIESVNITVNTEVYCRIGSLEKATTATAQAELVYCRIGSLEMSNLIDT